MYRIKVLLKKYDYLIIGKKKNAADANPPTNLPTFPK
jgi:hypothetical protein